MGQQIGWSGPGRGRQNGRKHRLSTQITGGQMQKIDQFICDRFAIFINLLEAAANSSFLANPIKRAKARSL